MTDVVKNATNEDKPRSTLPTRRIVCAANRADRDGTLVIGIRHYDSFMRDTMAEIRRVRWKDSEQGFIDQFGAFLTRTQAWPIALAAGQIIRRVGGDEANGGTLYSENLY